MTIDEEAEYSSVPDRDRAVAAPGRLASAVKVGGRLVGEVRDRRLANTQREQVELVSVHRYVTAAASSATEPR